MFKIFALVLVVFVFKFSPILAQNTDSNSPNNQSSLEKVSPAPSDINRQNLIDTVKEDVKEKKEMWLEKKAEVRVRAMEQVRTNSGKVLERYRLVVSRYENLILRIEKRIELEKALGKDTSEAEILLAEVKIEVSKILPVVEEANLKLSAVNEDSSEVDIKTVIGEVRNTMKAQKEILVTVKQNLRKIISILQALSVEKETDNGTN
ncbi:MAG: hypothetical protein ABIB98_02795 [bacterium]